MQDRVYSLDAMAGIASCFPSKPLLTRTLTATPSRLDSKLFGVRLFNIGTIKSSSISLSSTLGGSSVTARYGGGFRPSGPRNSRQYRKSDSDDDQALDISTIRYLWLSVCACVRSWIRLRMKLSFLVLK